MTLGILCGFFYDGDEDFLRVKLTWDPPCEHLVYLILSNQNNVYLEY